MAGFAQIVTARHLPLQPGRHRGASGRAGTNLTVLVHVRRESWGKKMASRPAVGWTSGRAEQFSRLPYPLRVV